MSYWKTRHPYYDGCVVALPFVIIAFIWEPSDMKAVLVAGLVIVTLCNLMAIHTTDGNGKRRRR